MLLRSALLPSAVILAVIACRSGDAAQPMAGAPATDGGSGADGGAPAAGVGGAAMTQGGGDEGGAALLGGMGGVGASDAGPAPDGGEPDASKSCAPALSCGDGSCALDHLRQNHCGCEDRFCIDSLCLRGECAGEAPFHFGGRGPTLDSSAAYVVVELREDVVGVQRLDDAASEPVTLGEVAVDELDFSSPVLDGTHVYFEVETHAGRDIYRVAKAGGEIEHLAHDGNDSGEELNVEVDASHVYWRGDNGIWRVPLAGGTALHWQHIGCGRDLTVTHGYVFFSCDRVMYRRSTSESDEVLSFDLAPYVFATDVVISGAYFASDPIVVGDKMYYVHDTSVVETDLGGSAAVTTYPLPFAKVDSIALDGERLFAVVHHDAGDSDSLLAIFPSLGASEYEIVAGWDAYDGAVRGMTERWLYIGRRVPRL